MNDLYLLVVVPRGPNIGRIYWASHFCGNNIGHGAPLYFEFGKRLGIHSWDF